MRFEPNTSPARMLEMLSDRFGAFEAIAYSTIKLARHLPEQELSMDLLVAEAVLEFADDLRAATAAAASGGDPPDPVPSDECAVRAHVDGAVLVW